MNSSFFYFFLVVAGIAALGLLWQDYRSIQKIRAGNRYVERRREHLDRIARLSPPITKGPHGFEAQNERRPTTTEKKEVLREWRTPDGQQRNRTASKGRMH